MHELALTQNIISIVESEAKKQGFTKVLSIKLKVGELSGVVPDCVRDFFPFAAKDTVAEGARIEAETVPATIRCLTCGCEGKPRMAACPQCGGTEIKLLSGREFFVDSIEVQ